MIIVDLELNQPSQKIIQIGSVRVYPLTGTISPFYETFVNPNERLDPFIAKMTRINSKNLKGGKSLGDSLREFWRGVLEVGALGAWGDDCRMLYNAGVDAGVDIPEGFPMYDLTRLCSFIDIAQGLPLRKVTGLKNNLRAYDLTFKGRHHNAQDDAHMTGELYLAMRNHMIGLLALPSNLRDECLTPL